MRILAFLLLPLSIAAYLNQKTNPLHAQKQVAGPTGSATNILFQSADGGKTWQDISQGLPEKLQVNCVLSQGGELYLGSENGTLYHSRDLKTGTWEPEDVGGFLSNPGGFFKAENVTGIFSGRSGPYACIYEHGFFRKAPGKSFWQPMHKALPEKTVYTVVEHADGNIFVACEKGIYKSEDDGKSWKHVLHEKGVGNLVSLDGVLLISGSQGLLRSTDGGEHWDCVLNDKGGIYNTSVLNGHFTAVRVAGPASHTSVEDVPERTSMSADGGKTWQRIDGGLSPDDRIYNIEQAGKFLFCSHKSGISRSEDGGKSWELVYPSTGLRDLFRFQLAVSGETVYAVVVWGGC